MLGWIVLDDKEGVRGADRRGRALAGAVEGHLGEGAERALAVHADLVAAVDLLLVLALERELGGVGGADRLVGAVGLRAAGKGEARGAVLERHEVGVDRVAGLREREFGVELRAVDHAGGLGVEVHRDDAFADGDDGAGDVLAGGEAAAEAVHLVLVLVEEGGHFGRFLVALGSEHGKGGESGRTVGRTGRSGCGGCGSVRGVRRGAA